MTAEDIVSHKLYFIVHFTDEDTDEDYSYFFLEIQPIGLQAYISV